MTTTYYKVLMELMTAAGWFVALGLVRAYGLMIVAGVAAGWAGIPGGLGWWQSVAVVAAYSLAGVKVTFAKERRAAT